MDYFAPSKYTLSVNYIIFGLPFLFIMIFTVWEKINEFTKNQNSKIYELNENLENRIDKLSNQLDNIYWRVTKYDRNDESD